MFCRLQHASTCSMSLQVCSCFTCVLIHGSFYYCPSWWVVSCMCETVRFETFGTDANATFYVGQLSSTGCRRLGAWLMLLTLCDRPACCSGLQDSNLGFTCFIGLVVASNKNAWHWEGYPYELSFVKDLWRVPGLKLREKGGLNLYQWSYSEVLIVGFI